MYSSSLLATKRAVTPTSCNLSGSTSLLSKTRSSIPIARYKVSWHNLRWCWTWMIQSTNMLLMLAVTEPLSKKSFGTVVALSISIRYTTTSLLYSYSPSSTSMLTTPSGKGSCRFTSKLISKKSEILVGGVVLFSSEIALEIFCFGFLALLYFVFSSEVSFLGFSLTNLFLELLLLTLTPFGFSSLTLPPLGLSSNVSFLLAV